MFEGLPEGFCEDQDTVVRYMKLLPPVFSDEDRRAEAAAVRVDQSCDGLCVLLLFLVFCRQNRTRNRGGGMETLTTALSAPHPCFLSLFSWELECCFRCPFFFSRRPSCPGATQGDFSCMNTAVLVKLPELDSFCAVFWTSERQKVEKRLRNSISCL